MANLEVRETNHTVLEHGDCRQCPVTTSHVQAVPSSLSSGKVRTVLSASPDRSRSKALLMSLNGISCEIYWSSSVFPSMYRSTKPGTFTSIAWHHDRTRAGMSARHCTASTVSYSCREPALPIAFLQLRKLCQPATMHLGTDSRAMARAPPSYFCNRRRLFPSTAAQSPAGMAAWRSLCRTPRLQ